MDIESYLISRMQFYTTRNLVGTSEYEFKEYLFSLLGRTDPDIEGYSDIGKQRDLSVKFVWGHNHDFGTFKLAGRMGDRHIKLFCNYLRNFSLKVEDIQGKDIFDIGCWTGGTSLLFVALGNRVTAIEEVKKYANVLEYLVNAFGVQKNIAVEAKSLFDCNNNAYYDKFDIAHFSGVIYHLTDPVMGLRIVFNSLRPNGICLVESLGIHSDDLICRYEGCSFYHIGTEDDLGRGGWNWFIPSKSTLKLMMENVGFEDVEVKFIDERLYATGIKRKQEDMTRAGLSIPMIR
jgi:SAM-dependent methyltransferase